MKKIIFIYISFFPFFSSAQRYEVGGGGGVMNYFGDLAQEIKSTEYHPSFWAFYRCNYDNYFSLKHSFVYGKISGSDANFSYNASRNLSFYTNIFEMNSMLEFNFLNFGFDKFSKGFSPFFAMGFSAFYFDPMTEYNHSAIQLRLLGTEGQFLRHSRTYSNVDWGIPLGGGLKFHPSKHFVFSIETIWRRTTTDYLDDVSNGHFEGDKYTGYPDSKQLLKFNNVNFSDRKLAVDLSDRSGEINPDAKIGYEGKQRGNPNNKDWFFTVGVSLSYKFITYECNKGGF